MNIKLIFITTLLAYSTGRLFAAPAPTEKPAPTAKDGLVKEPEEPAKSTLETPATVENTLDKNSGNSKTQALNNDPNTSAVDSVASPNEDNHENEVPASKSGDQMHTDTPASDTLEHDEQDSTNNVNNLVSQNTDQDSVKTQIAETVLAQDQSQGQDGGSEIPTGNSDPSVDSKISTTESNENTESPKENAVSIPPPSKLPVPSKDAPEKKSDTGTSTNNENTNNSYEPTDQPDQKSDDGQNDPNGVDSDAANNKEEVGSKINGPTTISTSTQKPNSVNPAIESTTELLTKPTVQNLPETTATTTKKTTTDPPTMNQIAESDATTMSTSELEKTTGAQAIEPSETTTAIAQEETTTALNTTALATTVQKTTPSEPEATTTVQETTSSELEATTIVQETTATVTKFKSTTAVSETTPPPVQDTIAPTTTDSPTSAAAAVSKDETTSSLQFTTSSTVTTTTTTQPTTTPMITEGGAIEVKSTTKVNLKPNLKSKIDKVAFEETTTAVFTPTTTSNNTDTNFFNKIKKYGHEKVDKYGKMRVILVLLSIGTSLILCCLLCKRVCCRRRWSKIRQTKLREIGQEKEFLLSDRKGKNNYANDRLTLLDDDSEDEF